jgi:hypothetical protein
MKLGLKEQECSADGNGVAGNEEIILQIVVFYTCSQGKAAVKPTVLDSSTLRHKAGFDVLHFWSSFALLSAHYPPLSTHVSNKNIDCTCNLE